MKALATIPFLVAADAAHAHPGHLVDAAGHNHWVAGAAIGAAIAVGVWGMLKGRHRSDAKADASETDDRQEA